ncbi:MAG: hypothetical protein ACP5OV_02230 [Acidimicrobiales bacterium]
MPMREECKHFQSRTYASGEVARFCVLGNAPDQPWSCPEDCVTYERRLADVGWTHGTLVSRPVEPVPERSSADERRSVLAEADGIIEQVAPRLDEERQRDLERQARGWRFWRRRA